MRIGKIAKPAAPGAPFRVADHLRNNEEIALYLEEMLADGDARAAAVALRTDALRRVSTLGGKAGR